MLVCLENTASHGSDWPRFDENGQISEHPPGGIWRDKNPLMRMS